MAGVSMRGGAQLAKLAEGLKRIRGPEFKRKLLKQLSQEGLHQVGRSFDSQTDPYGAAWAPLKHPSPKRQGGMILSDTGRLRNSFRASANPQTFVISSNVVYAAIHLYGGTITRTAGTKTVITRDRSSGRFLKGAKATQRNFGGGTSVIPARRYLPFPGRLGPHWTPAFTAIAQQMMARELGHGGGAH